MITMPTRRLTGGFDSAQRMLRWLAQQPGVVPAPRFIFDGILIRVSFASENQCYQVLAGQYVVALPWGEFLVLDQSDYWNLLEEVVGSR